MTPILKNGKTVIPDEAIKSVRKNTVALKGPLATPSTLQFAYCVATRCTLGGVWSGGQRWRWRWLCGLGRRRSWRSGRLADKQLGRDTFL